MKYRWHFGIFLVILSVASVAWNGCRRNATLQMSSDTVQPLTDTAGLLPRTDTAHQNADTAQPPLPPMAKAIEPDRLQVFLPSLPGWTQQGEIKKELQVRDNFNRSKAAEHYTMGAKTLTIQIDDFAYVPSLYEPWQKFRGTYLEDNNDERTETTTLSRYRAVQTMEKKTHNGDIVIFPGNRFVVTVEEDSTDDINEVRRIAEQVNLKGLETLE